MKKAVSYIRSAGDSQDGSVSLTAQSEIITKYARANGIVIAEAFADEGISPDLPNRDRMFSMGVDGAIDAILIVSETRLTRYVAELTTIHRRCARHGVEIVCCS
jgi:DNA invertase Pin-like site-specific DNA recombinase